MATRSMRIISVWTIIITLFLLSSCEKDAAEALFSNEDQISSILGVGNPTISEICDSVVMDLTGPNRQNPGTYGTLSALTSADSLYLVFQADAGHTFARVDMYLGDCDSMPIDDGNVLIGQLPYSDVTNGQSTVYYSFGLNELDSCFCVIGSPVVTGAGRLYAQGSYLNSYDNAQYSTICPMPCLDNDSCAAVTNTQGGWGAVPRGGNPGTFLHDNFTGLTLGCNTGYTIILTSAQAITDFLPQGGPAAPLTQNYTDPTGNISVLAGQVAALTLNIEADSIRNGSYVLDRMIINSGPFTGWTVNDFAEEANNMLGGCSTNYSVQDINDAATNINENFVDGLVDNGFLVCP